MDNPLTPADRQLIAAARAIIAARFAQDRHHIGAALRTRSGRVFAAVHVDAYVSRISVCAEAVAIGMAAAAGDAALETIVAVDRNGRIVSPCGMCRELISDYGADCRVILDEERAVPVGELLPHRYRRQTGRRADDPPPL